MSELKFQLGEAVRYAPRTFKGQERPEAGRLGRVLGIELDQQRVDLHNREGSGEDLEYWARYTVAIGTSLIFTYDDEIAKPSLLEQLAMAAE